MPKLILSMDGLVLKEIPLSVTDRTIGQGEPKVKQHHRQAATAV